MPSAFYIYKELAMKKGFTMIELIFVIVVLGILTTIAIPLLHGTREDAWIATTAANLRTLVSDVSAYYVIKEGFGTRTTNPAKWRDITNVPLKNHANAPITDQPVSQEVSLYVDDSRCIGVTLHDRVGILPAHIIFFTDTSARASDTCKEVLAAEPIRAFTQSTLRVGNANLPGRMAID